MLKVVIGALAVLIVGGLIFLSVWDIPAPSAEVEKPVPTEQLQPR